MAGSLSGGPIEDGAATADTAKDAYIAALIRERDGYVSRGMLERMLGVEAELERVGVERVAAEPERATVKPEAERAVKPRRRP